MTLKEKKVDFFQIKLNFIEGITPFTFEDILTSEEVLENEVRIKGKDFMIKILKKDEAQIVGIIAAKKKNGLPAKYDSSLTKITSLGFSNDDALLYPNIFLYDTEKEVLLYELNKNGCYIDHFILALYKLVKPNNKLKGFAINLNPLFTYDQYQKLLTIKEHTSIEIEIAHPSKIKEDVDKKGAFGLFIKTGKKLGGTKLVAKISVDARYDDTSLNNDEVKSIIDEVETLIQQTDGNLVEKLVVKGRSSILDNKKIQQIDLLAERLFDYISIKEPRENSDLLEEQREKEILKLIDKHEDELNRIISIKSKR